MINITTTNTPSLLLPALGCDLPEVTTFQDRLEVELEIKEHYRRQVYQAQTGEVVTLYLPLQLLKQKSSFDHI